MKQSRSKQWTSMHSFIYRHHCSCQIFHHRQIVVKKKKQQQKNGMKSWANFWNEIDINLDFPCRFFLSGCFSVIFLIRCSPSLCMCVCFLHVAFVLYLNFIALIFFIYSNVGFFLSIWINVFTEYDVLALFECIDK